FELFGAAVCIALFKIYKADESFAVLGNYLNSEKTLEIIMGILLSVVIAFTVGAIIQFITRYLVGFNFEKRSKWVVAAFGGVGITAIFHFIVIKGLKGSPVLSADFSQWVTNNNLQVLVINFAFWTLIAYLLQLL